MTPAMLRTWRHLKPALPHPVVSQAHHRCIGTRCFVHARQFACGSSPPHYSNTRLLMVCNCVILHHSIYNKIVNSPCTTTHASPASCYAKTNAAICCPHWSIAAQLIKPYIRSWSQRSLYAPCLWHLHMVYYTAATVYAFPQSGSSTPPSYEVGSNTTKDN